MILMLILASCSIDDPVNPNPDDNQNQQDNPNKPDDDNPSGGIVITPPSIEDKFEGYYEVLDGVYVSHLPGVYDEDFVLDFKFEDEQSILKYSLDCNTPNNFYVDGIKIDMHTEKVIENYPLTTSVDAILPNDTEGKCVSNMYINNIQNPKSYVLQDKQKVVTIEYIDSTGASYSRTLTYLNVDYDIPVISLSMPYNNWFGTNGFYNKIREEIEYRVNMEYFDSKYDEYFYRNSKIKLGGNWSLGYPQRTLNLNFNKDENGNKNKKVDAHIFEQRAMIGDSETRLSDLSRFRLHNGGNCFEERTGFSDAIIQNLMYGTNIATTAYRPCITYINGEYWGIYSIREHYSDTYFEDNYGVNKDDVALYELKGTMNFDDGNDYLAMEHLEKINNFLRNDFSNDAIYEAFINQYIDVDSLIDIFITQSFIGNWDFVGNYNNLKMWRTVKVDPNNPYADGKLRFCLHDADFAFCDTANFLESSHVNSYVKFNIYKKLLENKNFKIRFYERAKELLETNLSYENARKVIYPMVDDISNYKLASMKRWGNTTSYTQWRSECEKVLSFIKTRNEVYLPMVKNTLGI